MQENRIAPLTLGIEDVCVLLGGAKKSYVYYLVHQGRIKSARKGRELAFRPEWVEEPARGLQISAAGPCHRSG